MSLQFKHFVTVPFQKVVEFLHSFKGFSEEERMSFFRFKEKYNKELQIFTERYNQLQKEVQEYIKECDGDEEKIKEKGSEHIKKIEEILNMESELKPLDYDKIKKADFTSSDLELLAPVLKNLPEE